MNQFPFERILSSLCAYDLMLFLLLLLLLVLLCDHQIVHTFCISFTVDSSFSSIFAQNLFAQYEFMEINTIILWILVWCTLYSVHTHTHKHKHKHKYKHKHKVSRMKFAWCTRATSVTTSIATGAASMLKTTKRRNGILSFTYSLEICHIFLTFASWWYPTVLCVFMCNVSSLNGYMHNAIWYSLRVCIGRQLLYCMHSLIHSLADCLRHFCLHWNRKWPV